MYKINKYIIVVCCLLLKIFDSSVANAAVWQWSVSVKNSRDNKGQARAYLWIPPNCKKVKAFVFCQNNMEEQDILENSKFRNSMSELGFAEVWVSPAFDMLFHFDQGAGDTFNGIMNDLAATSGYNELRCAPFVAMGHSAAASNPYYMAAWNPERTLAAISVSGQWPYFRHPAFAPDIWGDKNIDYIPALESMGEYEAANTWSTEGLNERQGHPLMPLSMIANPAQGHFAATSAKIAYIALYIKKVAQYRLPQKSVKDTLLKLLRIDPTRTGWLVDKWRYNEPPLAQPAPVGKYKGNVKEAFWYIDKEIALATAAYEAKHRNQKPQLVGYIQHGKLVEQRNTHQQVNLTFEPEADGITFKLHAAFYDTVPGGSPRPSTWANKPVGQPVGHVSGGLPISIDRITGPVLKLNDSTFQISPQPGFWQNPHSYELWFAATHQGNAEYKPAVQQAEMIVPPRNTQGREQHISFAAISNQTESKKNVKLIATSDAKVPVRFYVQDGPAEVVGDNLYLTAIPPRSRYPVKVTVVAWQYGNNGEPKLQTATPVERTFWITK